MSRRSVFLLAATVVVLYFSIIVFMVSPLSGRRGYYAMSQGRFSMQGGPAVTWCRELRYRPPGPIVALVSFPGSGNTWLRYLLQQATGIMTGSIYMDYGLKVHGFPAENVTDGSVLVVKTHEMPQKNKFQAAVLLIRNPREAILADFNRLHKGHIGTAPKSAFAKQTHSNDWSKYVPRKVAAWQAMHEAWLSRFAGPIHIVYYEALVSDTRITLYEALDFLNQTITEEDMMCAMLHKEGIYRRRNKLQQEGFDPFTKDMYRALDTARLKVMKLISQYQKTHPSLNKDADRTFQSEPESEAPFFQFYIPGGKP